MGWDPPGRWHPFPPSCLLYLHPPSRCLFSGLHSGFLAHCQAPACLPHLRQTVSRAQLCSVLTHGSSLHQSGVPAPGPRTWAASVPAPLTSLPLALPALSPSPTDLFTAPSGHTRPPRWAHPPPHLRTASPSPEPRADAVFSACSGGRRGPHLQAHPKHACPPRTQNPLACRFECLPGQRACPSPAVAHFSPG